MLWKRYCRRRGWDLRVFLCYISLEAEHFGTPQTHLRCMRWKSFHCDPNPPARQAGPSGAVVPVLPLSHGASSCASTSTGAVPSPHPPGALWCVPAPSPAPCGARVSSALWSSYDMNANYISAIMLSEMIPVIPSHFSIYVDTHVFHSSSLSFLALLLSFFPSRRWTTSIGTFSLVTVALIDFQSTVGLSSFGPRGVS